MYDIIEGRRAKNGRPLVEVSPGLPDGIRVDVEGRIWSSSLSGVQVFTPDGERLLDLAVPEKTANLCFGGDDGRTLYIAASSSLYRIRTTTTDASTAAQGQGEPLTGRLGPSRNSWGAWRPWGIALVPPAQHAQRLEGDPLRRLALGHVDVEPHLSGQDLLLEPRAVALLRLAHHGDRLLHPGITTARQTEVLQCPQCRVDVARRVQEVVDPRAQQLLGAEPPGEMPLQQVLLSPEARAARVAFVPPVVCSWISSARREFNVECTLERTDPLSHSQFQPPSSMRCSTNQVASGSTSAPSHRPLARVIALMQQSTSPAQ